MNAIYFAAETPRRYGSIADAFAELDVSLSRSLPQVVMVAMLHDCGYCYRRRYC